MFEAVHRGKLFHDVARQLEAAIADGRLAENDALPSERELMAAFQVGRPAIRDALLVLQTKGLVTIHHGKRARVASPPGASLVRRAELSLALAYAGNDRLIEDIKEARHALEVAMVRKASLVATPAGLRRLDHALEANRRAIHSRDEFLATDIGFHTAIAAITDNRLFEAASAHILEWLARFRTECVHVEGANLVSYDEHATIAAAIRARNPDQAAEAMSRHQMRTHAIYQALGRPAKSPHTAPASARRG